MRAQKVRQLRIMITGLVCCVASWQAGMARAELVAVDWRGDYVSNSEFLADHTPANASGSNQYGDPSNGGNFVGRAVSDSLPYNPSSGYNLAAPSARFYGGHAVEWMTGSGNTGLTNLQVMNQGPADALQVEIKSDTNLKGYAALFYWQQPDFLNGLNNKVVDLSETFFTLKTTQVNVPSTNPDLLRWVIRNGTSDFYISNESKSVLNNSDYAYTSYAPSLTWKKYSPLSGLSGIHWSSGANAAGPLNNITAFGFYLDYGDMPHGVDMKIAQFLVTAKGNGKPGHVPEPGFALVGLFGAAFCTVRHLKNRRARKSVVAADAADAPESGLPAEQSTLIDC